MLQLIVLAVSSPGSFGPGQSVDIMVVTCDEIKLLPLLSGTQKREKKRKHVPGVTVPSQFTQSMLWRPPTRIHLYSPLDTASTFPVNPNSDIFSIKFCHMAC